jgi:hypothetical protein
MAGIANSAAVVTPSPSGLPPVTYPGGAVLTAVFNPNTLVLTYNLQWSFPTEAPTLAHFHRGAQGASGPVVVTIFSTPQAQFSPTPLTGSVTLTNDPSNSQVPQVSDLLGNNLYLQIHTAAWPAGAVRLQLRPVSNGVAFSAALTTASPSATSSAGTLAGTYDRSSRIMSFTLGYGLVPVGGNPDLATSALLIGPNPAGGTTNGTINTYNSSTVPPFPQPGSNPVNGVPFAIQGLYVGSATLTAAQETDFLANRYSFQINSTSAPTAGVIRGTVNTFQ